MLLDRLTLTLSPQLPLPPPPPPPPPPPRQTRTRTSFNMHQEWNFIDNLLLIEVKNSQRYLFLAMIS
jgi:hypothetical protein